MSDIQKLRTVISSLESQVDDMSKFNGLLSEVAAAKAEIIASQTVLTDAVDGHRQQVRDNSRNFDNLLARLSNLEKSLTQLESSSAAIEKHISEFDFVTTDHFGEKLKQLTAGISDSISTVTLKLDDLAQSQRKLAFRNLLITLLGFAVVVIVLKFPVMRII